MKLLPWMDHRSPFFLLSLSCRSVFCRAKIDRIDRWSVVLLVLLRVFYI